MENEETPMTAAGTPAPAAEPAPVAEPAAEPVAEPVAESVAEPAAEPVAEPVAEPAAEPVAEPVAEPDDEAGEPAVEPVRERRPPRQFLEATQEMLDDTSKRLSIMLDYLALEGTIRAEKHNSKINLIISSNDAGRIIGRKGTSLESLQLLLNRMMQKINPDYPKIYIDIDGYSPKSAGEQGGHRRFAREDKPFRRERNERFDRGDRSERGERGGHRREEGRDRAFADKDENLRQQALDTAKEVRRWCEPVTLPPMNAHDRRIIHVTLENEPDLSTDSVGEGAMKSVVVSMKKQD